MDFAKHGGGDQGDSQRNRAVGEVELRPVPDGDEISHVTHPNSVEDVTCRAAEEQTERCAQEAIAPNGGTEQEEKRRCDTER
jgi:hypothetical protein